MAFALHLLLALPSVALCLLTNSPAVEEFGTEADKPTKANLFGNNRTASRRGNPTADYYMRANVRRIEKAEKGVCLPELNEGFTSPSNGLPEQLAARGKVFFVGDSVIGQICQLGSPGLCCSAARPCKGESPFKGSLSSQEIQLDQLPRYANKGWQHLFEFKLRGDGDHFAPNTAYFVAPEVHDELETVETSVKLVVDFLEEKGTSHEDVLVLGTIGTHYNHDLKPFQDYVTSLMRKVVNTFPGRVVLLGYTPQHFSGAGHYSSGVKQCAPNPLPSDVDMPRNSFRSAIFLRTVWANLAHRKTRLVDFSVMLAPMWSCHRSPGDCTHWKDPVISMQVQLILDALQKLE